MTEPRFKETNLKLECGVAGTLAEPLSGNKQIVFILHGVGGHRDYCYQKMLGQALPAERNLATFRLDFRGCGESNDVEDPKIGRSVGGTDYQDLDSCYKYFTGRGYRVTAIVGHSRGASVMFLWCLRNPDVYIPYLINCSGRFNTWEYRDRVYAEQPHYQRDQGYSLVARRYGKYTPQWISMREVDEFCSWDSFKYARIDKRTQVITFFGAKDHHVPPHDCGKWANLFDGRHTLKIILDADHNFYSRDKDGKKINHNPAVVEGVLEWLAPEAQLERFNKQNLYSGFVSRWHAVEGVENLRDFGGYGSLKSGILFRSAHLDNITEKGKRQLQELGIKHIFDFRSLSEEGHLPVIPGVKIIQTPIFKRRDMSPKALADRYGPMLGKATNRGFEHSYMEILASGKPVFKQIMECIRDHPGEGVLVHCTAGKDRTGIFCGALLVAMGVDEYTASRDYELTTIGWKSTRELMVTEFTEKLKNLDIDIENVKHVLSSKFESMEKALQLLKANYGSAYDYFLQCGLSASDLATVGANLTRAMI